jgi:hypothetical protein|tara:strand:+ start:1246 stop:1461 length:216 start_codon:yes stop_codon:yes gene_type:complete
MTKDFKTWLNECDKIVESKLALSIHDLPDAEWASYFEDGLSPLDGIQCAYDDYWSLDFQFMGINEDFGVFQ